MKTFIITYYKNGNIVSELCQAISLDSLLYDSIILEANVLYTQEITDQKIIKKIAQLS